MPFFICNRPRDNGAPRNVANAMLGLPLVGGLESLQFGMGQLGCHCTVASFGCKGGSFMDTAERREGDGSMNDARVPPQGFVDPAIGGFVGTLGPIYRCDEGGASHSGFYVEVRHCNPSGICHGGWLSTFADVAMVRQAGQPGMGALTLGMSLDFLEAVPEGAWVESRCETVRISGRTVHVHGIATVDGRSVLRMNGTFRLIDHVG